MKVGVAKSNCRTLKEGLYRDAGDTPSSNEETQSETQENGEEDEDETPGDGGDSQPVKEPEAEQGEIPGDAPPGNESPPKENPAQSSTERVLPGTGGQPITSPHSEPLPQE